MQTFSQHKGVGDAAANDQTIDFFCQALQNGQLGADLAAGHDGNQRTTGIGQRLGNGVHFGGQQRARTGHRGKLCNAVSGTLGAVRCTEGVVYEDIAQCCHFFGQIFVVLLFSLVEAAVF